MLSMLGYRDAEAYVPGIRNIIEGGYETKNGTALSFEEKQARGKAAVQALADYKKAVSAKDSIAATLYKSKLDENYAHFGYGYLDRITSYNVCYTKLLRIDTNNRKMFDFIFGEYLKKIKR